MHLQSLKDQRPDPEHHNRKDPKVHGRIEILKKPLFFTERTPVSIYNIYQWINFYDGIPDWRLVLQHSNAPEDRRRPHADLQHDGNNLCQIPEKYDDRAGRIGQPQYQNKCTKTVINDLYRIDRRITSVACRYDQKHQNKKQVDKGRRDHLDDRQDADLKNHLFYQIIIFKKRRCPVV